MLLGALIAAMFAASLGFFQPQPAAAEVVDRIVAIVNGNVILQSDWDEALSFEALLTNRSLPEFSADDRRAVLDRLIDQELLREQMKSADSPHASDADISARVAAARKLYPQAASDEGWQEILAQYHLTEKGLMAHVRQEIELMRLVDARLRPAVQIDSKSIEAYYRDQFVPQLKQAGSGEVPLADVSARIREVLTQKKVNELLISWLQTLRSEGQVQVPGVSGNDRGVQSQ
ncbi:MAG: SurA N-terminal domain-containing protein [Candidatus Sulfotelmatobacter sp.]